MNLSEGDLIEGLSVWQFKRWGIWAMVGHYRATGGWNLGLKVTMVLATLAMVPELIFLPVAFLTIKINILNLTVWSVQMIACLHVYTKNVVFWKNLKSISKMFELMRKDFLTSIPEDKRASATEMYRRSSKVANLIVIVMLVSAAIVFVQWNCVPTFPVEYLDPDGKVRKRYKLTGAWFPGPMAESPYFEIIIAYEVFIDFWICAMAPGYLFVFVVPMVCLITHYMVLSDHLSILKADAEDCNSDAKGKNEESAMYKHLQAILQDHKKLISYTNEFRKLCNPMVTETFTLAMYMESLCIFQALFGSQDIWQSMKFIQTMVYAVGEIALYCYGSSFLESASSGLELAVYNSEWYKADLKYRKIAHIMMLGSRKGLTLTAFKMYPVTLETMVDMYRMIYSAAALMSSMVS